MGRRWKSKANKVPTYLPTQIWKLVARAGLELKQLPRLYCLYWLLNKLGTLIVQYAAMPFAESRPAQIQVDHHSVPAPWYEGSYSTVQWVPLMYNKFRDIRGRLKGNSSIMGHGLRQSSIVLLWTKIFYNKWHR